MHAFGLNWLQQTLLHSARRGHILVVVCASALLAVCASALLAVCASALLVECASVHCKVCVLSFGSGVCLCIAISCVPLHY